MTPCKHCGVVPEHHVEYDICDHCGGTARDEIGNDCIFCEHGEATIEEYVCGCDPYGDDFDAPATPGTPPTEGAKP